VHWSAFQLANSGRYATLDHIKKRLKGEGYSTEKITGGALSKQLRALIQTALKIPTDGSTEKARTAGP